MGGCPDELTVTMWKKSVAKEAHGSTNAICADAQPQDLQPDCVV